MMNSARRLAAIGFVLALAACASTHVSDRKTNVSGKLPRPNRIMVYPFGVTPDDVPNDSAPTAAECSSRCSMVSGCAS